LLNEVGVADEFGELLRMGVERQERAAGCPAGGRERRAAECEDLIEQLSIGEFVALVARLDQRADDVGTGVGAALGDDFVDQLGSVVIGPHALRREGVTRLGVGRQRQHVVECEDNRFAALVEVDHRGEQSANDELRPVIFHGVERVAAPLDRVQHMVDDLGDARLDSREAARGERRHQQPADCARAARRRSGPRSPRP
jgi:hypothetical protein